MLSTAWHVVVRRALSDRMILLAAALTIVLATMLVASGPIYADAVTLSALQATLDDAEVAAANVSVSTRVTAATFAETDAVVVEQLERTFSITGYDGTRRGTSDSYSLPVAPGAAVTDLAVFRYLEGIEEHATIVDGSWPTASGPPHGVALPRPASEALGLGLGDELRLLSRRDGTTEISIAIAGIYEVDDAGDPFWFGDELDLAGISEGTSFTTYGPFVIPVESFFASAAPTGAKLDWRVYPVHANLTVGDIGEVRGRLQGLEGQLNVGREAGNQMLVTTDLVDILGDTQRSLLVTRSTMLIITLQFSLFAGYALLLTAGLLSETRQVEIELLRSRGAGSRQVLSLALMEGVVLISVAAAAAPSLAALALRGFNYAGPLADIELNIAPQPTAVSYVVAGLVGVGCLVALTAPSFRAARAFGTVRARRSRQQSRGLAQRARLDGVLLAVAAVALWQLRRYGAPITETIEGGLGIDPLLVAAPALGLLAGGMVALRTLPLLTQTAESVMSASRRLVPVLGAWQVARRPHRYARIALFLTMAVAIGSFTVGYAGTWQASQSDRAAYDVGADIRHDRNRRFDADFPARVLDDAYEQLEGLRAATPVLRERGRLARSPSTVRYLILDAARAPDVAAFRPDLSDIGLADLMAPLSRARRQPAAVALPGEPAGLAIDVGLQVEPLADDFIAPPNVPDERLELPAGLRAVILDGNGHLFRIDFGGIEQTGAGMRMVAELDHRIDRGLVLQPSYPLSIAALEVRSALPRFVVRRATLTINRIAVLDADGTEQELSVPGRADWVTSVAEPRVTIERPTASLIADPADRLVLDIMSGSTPAEGAVPVFFGILPKGNQAQGPIPVIVSSELADELGLGVGDEIPLDLPGLDGRGVITGTVSDFPTIDPQDGEPIVLDYQTYMAARYRPGISIPSPDEVWLSVADVSLAAATAQLAEAPFTGAGVVSRAEQQATYESDPVARGTIGSLFLGFVATAVLTGVGFAVNAAVSARERLAEFALLRAAGLSSRQLVGWLSLENVVLVGFGLLAGTALGSLLIWLILPLTALAQDATAAVPAVIVVYPWRTVLWFELGVVMVLMVAVAVLSAVLKRSGLEAILRVGGV